MIKSIAHKERKPAQQKVNQLNIIFDLSGVFLIKDTPHDLLRKKEQNQSVETTLRPINLLESISLLRACKEAGHNLYVLSNMSKRRYEEGIKNPEIASLFSFFDDIVLSYMTEFEKPQPEIYSFLCLKNNIKPSQCIFIDDKIENLQGAQEAFIPKTILCQDFNLQAVKNKLIEFGVLPQTKASEINIPTGRA